MEDDTPQRRSLSVAVARRLGRSSHHGRKSTSGGGGDDESSSFKTLGGLFKGKGKRRKSGSPRVDARECISPPVTGSSSRLKVLPSVDSTSSLSDSEYTLECSLYATDENGRKKKQRSIERGKFSSSKKKRKAEELESEKVLREQLLGALSIPQDPSNLSWSDTVAKKRLKQIQNKDVKRQELIYELIQTEMGFFRHLALLKMIYMDEILMKGLLTNEEVATMFSNLQEIIRLNAPLHSILQKLQMERKGDVVEEIGKIMDSWLGSVSPKTYAVFCASQKQAVELYHYKMKHDHNFAEVLASIESRIECARLKFPDFMAKVMQRLSKYPLLLKGIAKYTSKKLAAENTYLLGAEEKAKMILNVVDGYIKAKMDEERLIHLQNHFDFSACVGESLKQYKLLDIRAGKRSLIREGPLDIVVDHAPNKEVHVILLSDVILFTQVKDSSYLLKCPGKNAVKANRKPPVLLLKDTHVRPEAAQKKGIVLINKHDACIYQLRALRQSQQAAWLEAIKSAVESENKGNKEPQPLFRSPVKALKKIKSDDSAREIQRPKMSLDSLASTDDVDRINLVRDEETHVYGLRIRDSDNFDHLFVSRVLPQGAAGRAGIRKGDMIVAINDTPISKDFAAANANEILSKEDHVILDMRFQEEELPLSPAAPSSLSLDFSMDSSAVNETKTNDRPLSLMSDNEEFGFGISEEIKAEPVYITILPSGRTIKPEAPAVALPSIDLSNNTSIEGKSEAKPIEEKKDEESAKLSLESESKTLMDVVNIETDVYDLNSSLGTHVDTTPLFVVLDVGTTNIRVGFAGDDVPEFVFPSIVATRASGDDAIEYFCGADVLPYDKEVTRDLVKAYDNISLPLKLPKTPDSEIEINELISYSIRKVVDIYPNREIHVFAVDSFVPNIEVFLNKRQADTQSIIASHPNVAAVMFGDQAYLSCLGSGRRCALVLYSGDQGTYAMPVVRSRNAPDIPVALSQFCQRSPIGGQSVTDALMSLLDSFVAEDATGLPISDPVAQTIVENIKETHAYVALDYAADLQSCQQSAALEASYLIGDHVVLLSKERFECTEHLFNPKLAENKGTVIQDLIRDAINACAREYRDELWNNIVLSGGNTLFSGFEQRLRKELLASVPSQNFHISAEPERRYYPWIGGSNISTLEFAQTRFVTSVMIEEQKQFARGNSMEQMDSYAIDILDPAQQSLSELEGFERLQYLTDEIKDKRQQIKRLEAETAIMETELQELYVTLSAEYVEDTQDEGEESDGNVTETSDGHPKTESNENQRKETEATVDDTDQSALEEKEEVTAAPGVEDTTIKENDHPDSATANHSEDTDANNNSNNNNNNNNGRPALREQESFTSTNSGPLVDRENNILENFVRVGRKPVETWKTRDVESWMALVELDELVPLFLENGIIGMDLLDLDEEDLRSMDIDNPNVILRCLSETSLLSSEPLTQGWK